MTAAQQIEHARKDEIVKRWFETSELVPTTDRRMYLEFIDIHKEYVSAVGRANAYLLRKFIKALRGLGVKVGRNNISRPAACVTWSYARPEDYETYRRPTTLPEPLHIKAEEMECYGMHTMPYPDPPAWPGFVTDTSVTKWIAAGKPRHVGTRRLDDTSDKLFSADGYKYMHYHYYCVNNQLKAIEPLSFYRQYKAEASAA